ncbi:hypothetical protein ACS0TY_006990 [Phlomoides rotata]
MRVLSYNFRGLGCREKIKEVGEIIRKKRVDFCLIQETKKEEIDEQLCKTLWDSNKVGWAFRGVVGRSGGILSMWNNEMFSALSCWHMEGAVVVNGLWGSDRMECCIVNIYAPCMLVERVDLWDRIQQVISLNSNSCVYVAGDFNSIRRVAERAGRRVDSSKRDIGAFDSFIRDSGLIDLSLHGSSFTWYRPDGSCKSRLDRFLINNSWISKWLNSSQVGLQRSLSDHCPIVLEIKVKDWGP